MRARGAIYGTKDAGRQWWLHLREVLVQHGWKESIYEPCLFMLRDKTNKLVGLLCTHVDDLFVTGEGDFFSDKMGSIEKLIHLAFKDGEFRYCGKDVKQNKTTFEIKIGQAASVDALEFVPLEPHRRKKPDAPLTPEEVSSLRSGVGSLGWIARQSRPDLAVYASLGAQSMSGPKIEDVVEVNKAIKMAKEDMNFEIVFPRTSIGIAASCLGAATAVMATWTT